MVGDWGRVLLLIDLSRKAVGAVGAGVVSAYKVSGWSYCVPYRGSARERSGRAVPRSLEKQPRSRFPGGSVRCWSAGWAVRRGRFRAVEGVGGVGE